MANNSRFVTSKKQSLLDYKSKLLYDIKKCEREIDEARTLYNRNLQYRENGLNFDSDSDDDAIYQKLVKTAQIKNRSIEKDALDNLQICLQATEELTDLHILHSDVSIMVEPPQLTEQYKHEEVEEGVWREVHADCKADFIPFSIEFYVHQPYRKHSPPSYHNVQVGIVKKNHERELEQSILNEVQRPSDAIQIMRNYAVAHRCRRTTLNQLAEKYGDGGLYMEVLSDGGYLLRCSDMLDLTWRLENKWSPVARFYHQMKLNVDSMDDHYIKIIKKAFMQLRQPNMKADERAFLLSEIIDICIQFKRDNNDTDSSNDIDNDIVCNKSSSNQRFTSNEEGRKRKKKSAEDRSEEKCLAKKAKHDVVCNKTSSKQYTSNEEDRNRKKKPAEDRTEEECVAKKAKPSNGREITELVEKITKASDDRQTTKKKSENVISKNTQENQNNEGNQQKKINQLVENRNIARSDDKQTNKKDENVISKNTHKKQQNNNEGNKQQKKITQLVGNRNKARPDDKQTNKKDENVISKNTHKNQQNSNDGNNQQKKINQLVENRNIARSDDKQTNKKDENVISKNTQKNQQNSNDGNNQQKKITQLVGNRNKARPDDKQTNKKEENVISKNTQKNQQNNKDQQKKITQPVGNRNIARSDDRQTDRISKNKQMSQGKNVEYINHNQKNNDNTEKVRTAEERNKETNKSQQRQNKERNDEKTLKEKQDKLQKNKHSSNPNVKNINTQVNDQQKNKQTENKDKQNKIEKANKISRDDKENNIRTKIPQKITLHKKFGQNPLRSSPRKSPRQIAGTIKKSVFNVKGKSEMAVKASNKLIKK